MSLEKTDGMIRHTRLHNESREYLERREELRRAEVELIRHPWLADDMHERGEDLTIAVYNLLDLTRAGRGDWYARLDYGVDVHWGAYPPTS